MDGCLQGCSFIWWLFLLLMVSDRALHVSSASFCKANEGITRGVFSLLFPAAPVYFLWCCSPWSAVVVNTFHQKKRSGVQSFLSQICKALFVWPRCQEALTSLVLNKREGQPRRINLITFIVHVTEEVLNMWYCGRRISVLPVRDKGRRR